MGPLIRLMIDCLLIFTMIRLASNCFPIENAGRQDCMHIIARPLINEDNKNSENNVRPTVAKLTNTDYD